MSNNTKRRLHRPNMYFTSAIKTFQRITSRIHSVIQKKSTHPTPLTTICDHPYNETFGRQLHIKKMMFGVLTCRSLLPLQFAVTGAALSKEGIAWVLPDREPFLWKRGAKQKIAKSGIEELRNCQFGENCLCEMMGNISNMFSCQSSPPIFVCFLMIIEVGYERGMSDSIW